MDGLSGYTLEELATKLPSPPPAEVLRARLRPEDFATIPLGTELWHIYKRGGDYPVDWDNPRHFGPIDARYAHHRPPRPQDRGILYLAPLIATCAVEVFQATREIDRARGQPWLVAHATTRNLTLLDVTGAWPTRAGASMVINNGPRALTRRWSSAV